MARIGFTDEEYSFLIQILNEKFYETTDIDDYRKINQIYKRLRYEPDSWLSQLKNKSNWRK